MHESTIVNIMHTNVCMMYPGPYTGCMHTMRTYIIHTYIHTVHIVHTSANRIVDVDRKEEGRKVKKRCNACAPFRYYCSKGLNQTLEPPSSRNNRIRLCHPFVTNDLAAIIMSREKIPSIITSACIPAHLLIIVVVCQ